MTRAPLSQGMRVERYLARGTRITEVDIENVAWLTICPYDYWPDAYQVEQPAPGSGPGASLPEDA